MASLLFRFSVIKLSMSPSLSCPISVCSAYSVKSVSVNKSSSSLKKSSLKDPNKSQLGSSPGSSSSAIIAPSSAGIHPVVNRLNQDTTVYYILVFCAFSWPYMVKWHNSGIIKCGIAVSKSQLVYIISLYGMRASSVFLELILGTSKTFNYFREAIKERRSIP